jgi:8-oxo-dGTP pyrophosphatase MutT (NUDIX family)
MANPELDHVLRNYLPADDVESAEVARIEHLVATAADPWDRSLPLHLTASALIVHPPTERVLLRWHAKQQRWLQVGGHADPGEADPWTVAFREAVEETTLDDLRPHPGPGHAVADIAIVTVNETPAEPAHEHADLRYVLATDSPDAVPGEVEDVPLRWVSVPEALDLADAWLDRLIRKAAFELH